MIILITGKLGGGKTYWSVNYVVEKYYEYKQSIFQYVPNRKNIRIVTNIDSLDLPHDNLELEVDKKGLEGVFCPEYVGDDSVVFIIDEAQRPKYFHRKFYNPKVFEFFQMSRHYGCDVLLITQDVNSLARELKFLCEYEIRAIPRSRRTKNVFMYQYLADDEVFKRQILKFDKRIGSLYRSQHKDETSKMPRVWRPYAIGAAIAIVVVFFGFKFFINQFREMGQPKTAHASTVHKRLIGEKLPGEKVPQDKKVLPVSSAQDLAQEKVESKSNDEKNKINNVNEHKSDKDIPQRSWFDSSLETKFKEDFKNAKTGNILRDASGRVSGYVLYH